MVLVGLAFLEDEVLMTVEASGANVSITCEVLNGASVSPPLVAVVFDPVPPDGQKYLARETPAMMTA
jgi:hypothetical protein